MAKRKSTYQDNKNIMEDEATYPDKNTIALIDLIVEIVVDRTMAQLEEIEDPDNLSPPPQGWNRPARSSTLKT